MLALLVAVHLIALHTVDGHQVAINPMHVTTLHAAKPGEDNKLFTAAVQCVVGLTDGKFVSVVESCDQVRTMLEQTR